MRFTIASAICVSVLLSLLPSQANAELRCGIYKHLVRKEAEQTLGSDYPWHYNLGQLQQESRCRPDVTAFDGGMGLAQFMPATVKAIEKQSGQTLDAYSPHDAIKLQALFLRDLIRSCPAPALWVTYQAYNGGCVLLKREHERAGLWNHEAMFEACKGHRNILTLKNGSKLDLCKVNYEYPVLVRKYGEAYRIGPDKIPFWSEK